MGNLLSVAEKVKGMSRSFRGDDRRCWNAINLRWSLGSVNGNRNGAARRKGECEQVTCRIVLVALGQSFNTPTASIVARTGNLIF